MVGTCGATFYITGVQLEAGSVASPFERRDYGRELLMCQRYFSLVPFIRMGKPAQSNFTYAIPVATTMRVSPTVVLSDNDINDSIPSAGTAIFTQPSFVVIDVANGTSGWYDVSFAASSEL